MIKTNVCRTFSETVHETLLGNVALLYVHVGVVVDKRLNLVKLSNGWDPQHQYLNQWERIGCQPIAQHRLQTFSQSASAAAKQTSEIPLLGFVQTLKQFSRTFQDLERPNYRVFQDSKNAFSRTFQDTLRSQTWLHEVKKCTHQISFIYYKLFYILHYSKQAQMQYLWWQNTHNVLQWISSLGSDTWTRN